MATEWKVSESDKYALRCSLLFMAERLTVACLQYKTPVNPEQANAVMIFKNWYETANELLMKENADETS